MPSFRIPRPHTDSTIHTSGEPSTSTSRGSGAVGSIVNSPVSVTPSEAMGISTTPSRGPYNGRRPQGSSLPRGPNEVAAAAVSGESPGFAGRATHQPLSLEAARNLVDSKGLSFAIPPFLEDKPPMPKLLTELPRVPTSLHDIPITSPKLREMYLKYTKDKETWRAQKTAYRGLVNKYTMNLGDMIARGTPMELVVKTWIKLGSALDAENKAILLNRFPEKESLTKLLFLENNHFLTKEEFQFPGHFPNWASSGLTSYIPSFRWFRGLSRKDAEARDALNVLKHEMESQLQWTFKDPASTLGDVRDQKTKMQTQFQNQVDKAVLDKKNRSGWHMQWRSTLAWVGSIFGIHYGIDKFISLLSHWFSGDSSSPSMGNSTGNHT